MPSKHSVLEELKRDELLAALDLFGLEVADRRVRVQLIGALAGSRKARLAAALGELPRTRLKEICRALGLDDSGREKALLISRLTGTPASSPAPSASAVEPRSSNPAVATRPARKTDTGASPPPTRVVQDLRSHLWNCAEILRGSAVDRTDWKAYILPLVFFKRICDVWDEETAEATSLYGDVDPVDFPEVHRFSVPEGCRWSDVRATPANLGAALSHAMREIERANPDTLYRVFGAADWGNREILTDEIL